MSIKLWEKGYEVDPIIEAFTIGNDYKTDMRLIKYDIKASMAHAEMLCKKGYLSRKELKEIKSFHDRFLIIDKNEIYHIGASIKDLGKKVFAFSKLNIDINSFELLKELN